MAKKQNSKSRNTKSKKPKTLVSLLTALIVLAAGGGGVGYYFANQKEKVVLNTSVSLEKTSDLRLMSWNVLNFGGSNTAYNSNKMINIATTILSSQADVVGLEEINWGQETSVKNLVKLLNQNNQEETWQYVISPLNVASYRKEFENSREQIAVLYRKDKVKVLNSGFKGKEIYARPLYYVQFESVTKSDYKFVSIFGHFDAPDVNTKNGETKSNEYSGQGNQEIKEAKALAQILVELKTQYNCDIIFGGDTNIKAKNNSAIESEKYALGYVDFETNLEYYKTSLSNKVKAYSEPYDKWAIIDTGTKNVYYGQNYPYKIDIISAFKEDASGHSLWNRQESVQNYKRYKNDKPNPTDLELIRDVSDHAPILVDIKFN
ncbi:MnuA family membrane nuclease [Mycoplasma sp. 1573]